jgi:hypothetical protein
MKLSRKAKRYDESVLPGDFQDFVAFEEGDLSQEGMLSGNIRHIKEGVQLGDLSLERQTPKKQSFAKLKSKAERLTQEVTYLRERLEIVDHDRRGMYIQLRSLPPYKDDHQIQFNEISIGKDRVVLKRIAFYRKDEVKQQVPLSLTEEELRRLFCDLKNVFGSA